MTNPFDFSDLASTDDQIAAETRKGPKKNEQKFDCVECGGSGLWQGGRQNQHGNRNCWTCGGKGYVKTDPRKLRADRIKRAQKKRDALADFREEHADVIRELENAAGWSSFAASLVDQLATKPWSEKQLAAARGMAAKLIAKREERAKAREAAAVEVDLTPIRQMFDAAVASGYKAPKYRAEGFIITRAPDHGRNAGHLYVKSEADCYMGKISPAMKFFGVRDAQGSGVEDALAVIAADPLGAAVRYGNRTGRCACCGRELTNDESIQRGIGPICAERWGLGDMVAAPSKEEAKAELDEVKKDLFQ